MPLERYTFEDLAHIYEETGRELRQMSWPQVIRRVKTQKITPTYLGVTKDGRVLFKTNSGTTPGKYWYQQIKFKDLETGLALLYSDPTVTHKAMLDLIQKGDLLVYCDDLSFKYWGWQYIGSIRGYSLRPNYRYPRKRNPNLTGGVCKHLIAVLQVLPFFTSKLVHDFRKAGVLDPDWNVQRRQLLRNR